MSDTAASGAFVAVGVLIAAGFLGWMFVAGGAQDPAEAPAPAPVTVGDPGPSADPAPAVGVAPARADLPAPPLPLPATTAASAPRIVYPGGVQMAPLNGVTEVLQIQWGKGPFTPVVGIETGPGGWQWYVHENGARSTVVNSSVNDVPQVIGLVAEPGQPLPVWGAGGPPVQTVGK